MKSVFSMALLCFILSFTSKGADKPITSNLTKTSDTTNPTDQKIFDLINEQVSPLINGKDAGRVDFAKLEKDIVTKYGAAGERVFWVNQAFYYYQHGNHKEFVTAKSKLHKKYPDAISIFDVNNDAWYIFQNVSDAKMLNEALAWSKKVIEKEPTANYYDTYANVLYKLGRTQEAIKIEEKALKMEAGNGNMEEIKGNLEKMKAGVATWPEREK